MTSYVAGHAGLRHSTRALYPARSDRTSSRRRYKWGVRLMMRRCSRDRVDRENWMRILDSGRAGIAMRCATRDMRSTVHAPWVVIMERSAGAGAGYARSRDLSSNF